MAESKDLKALTGLFDAVGGMTIPWNVGQEQEASPVQPDPSRSRAAVSALPQTLTQSFKEMRDPKKSRKRRVPRDHDPISPRVDEPVASSNRPKLRLRKRHHQLDPVGNGSRSSTSSTGHLSLSGQNGFSRLDRHNVRAIEEENSDEFERPQRRRRLESIEENSQTIGPEEESADALRPRRRVTAPSPSPPRRTKPGQAISREQYARDWAKSRDTVKFKEQKKIDSAKRSSQRTFEGIVKEEHPRSTGS